MLIIQVFETVFSRERLL